MDQQALTYLKGKIQIAEHLQRHIEEVEKNLKELEQEDVRITLKIGDPYREGFLSQILGQAVMALFFKESIKEALIKLQNELTKEFQEL